MRFRPAQRLVAVLIACGLASAAIAGDSAVPPDQRPSDASIRRLLELQDTQAVINQTLAQMDELRDRIINQQLGSGALSEQQQQQLERARADVHRMVAELLDWNTALEPMYLAVFRDTFTQQEVDAMIAFYSTPVGRSIVGKMPFALQRAMTEVQQQLMAALPKIREMAQERARQIKAQGAAGP